MTDGKNHVFLETVTHKDVGVIAPAILQERITTMPGFTTHYIMGMKAYNDMPSNTLKHIISKYRWLYQLGLQVKVNPERTDLINTKMIDGSKVALSELRGKVVLLNFWATWCPPCREELSHVQQQVIDRFAGEEFVFLPISRGEERAAVEAFRAKTGYAFPMGLDTDETIYKRYATRFIPRNFLIDRTGRVVKATVGYDDEEFAELLRAADAEIQQK